MAVIESVPNVSEGRRPDVVEALAAAVRGTAGVRLLDCSSDESHNRSVLTLAGEAEGVRAAILALFEKSIETIDLRSHRGEHPRIGAVDVVPFVPIDHVAMADCVMLAHSTAAAVAERFHVPVYLYEDAAATPARKNLEDIRRGGFEGLADKMRDPAWAPDFGPPAPHPTAGASVIGARMPLIAYNVNLATDRIDVARQIAASVRQRGGGLPFVKAIPVSLAERGIVQVSMNLTNYAKTPIARAFEAVKREAGRRGVEVLDSEIVGLVPEAALTADDARLIQLHQFSPNQILENRLRQK